MLSLYSTSHPPQAASGDIFIVGLNDVQSMLHKRRLGPKGVKVFKKFENQTSKADWDEAKVPQLECRVF